MNSRQLKVLGCIAGVAGLGVKLVADWVSEQKQDRLIEEKVRKEIRAQQEENVQD